MDSELSPQKIKIAMDVVDEVILFDTDGWATLDICVVLEIGESLILHSGSDDQLRIGARCFTNDDLKAGTIQSEAIKPPRQLHEFRAISDQVELSRAQKFYFNLPIYVDPASNTDVLVKVDLVKEEHYWLEELGHDTCTKLHIESRKIIRQEEEIRSRKFKSMLVYEDSMKAREKRGEYIIFSLLNSLKNINNQGRTK